MRLRHYQRILWDFNGTLLDDVALCIACANRLLARRALPAIPDDDAYRRVFGFPVQSYYARIGLESEGEGFVSAAHEWMEEYLAGEGTATLRPGAEKLLAAIRAAGVPQGVLSATESGMLTRQLTALSIDGYFDSILARDDIYAKDKSAIAARYAQAHPEERVLMIGDTVHDCETARAGRFDCVLLEGGHQGRDTLAECGCPVMLNFEELGAWLGV
jgi:phosphoglycolate phosphatase